MNILAINGSPRSSGSTAAALDVLADRIGSRHRIERADLGKLRVSHCSGCRLCTERGECVIDDDMAELYIRMRESGMVVFASPVYFGFETGLFKNFLDRMYAIISNRNGKLPEGSLTKASIILTCDSPDGAMKYASVTTHLMSVLRQMGVTDTSSVILPSGPGLPERMSPYLDEVEFQLM